MGTLILRFLLETGPPFYVPEPREGPSSCLLYKGSNSISQLSFKTLSVGPTPPGIEHAISRSAVKSLALPTELILPIAIKGANRKKSLTMDSGRGSVGLDP